MSQQSWVRGHPKTLSRIAEVCSTLGNPERATAILQQALHATQDIETSSFQSDALVRIAQA